MGETPNTGGGVIKIDKRVIEKLHPDLSKPIGDLGGILVVVIYHEYKHADGSFVAESKRDRECQEIQLINQVAQKNCELIEYILGANGDVGDLCKFYDDIRDNYNIGSLVPGGASAKNAENNCSESYPGDIPSCPGC